ncbi:PREDICTED: polycystic kidney disease and receptor for egg jelly-related protein [Miniopterus natalensis]|uniref:polycystic kidney disease and receptor for egg jelly-related protein n=1 Tax=Miniopterus natalensis TaxID=291302 RepID=UPI0007A70D6E|nr:PREDICTED: polycystic kidney disease and receptor for egg jelly-related protein [Miniopterus natalensis]
MFINSVTDASSAPSVSPGSVLPGGPRPHARSAAPTECPTDGLTPVASEAVNSDSFQAAGSSVSGQLSGQETCVIKTVLIYKPHGTYAGVYTRKSDIAFGALFHSDCASAVSTQMHWSVYSVPALFDNPDWTKPLAVPQLQVGQDSMSIFIPKDTFSPGVYVFRFSVSLVTPKTVVDNSTYIYIEIVSDSLKAVILGNANTTVNFTEWLVLNGSMSSDPDVEDPLEGLQFSWYCTTNPSNYVRDKIQVISKDVCHRDQTDLKWPLASDPVLTLLPRTLKGGQVYFFRMVIKKHPRTAFADRMVKVLQGPTPTAYISCIENCNKVLIVSDRFSLFLNCTDCAISHDIYKWSILSSSGVEIAFDWTGQTSTGRDSDYLTIKAFAFGSFLESRYWISLDLAAWSGVVLALKYPFTVNYVPDIGECKINPTDGIAFLTKFVVQCRDFKDQNVPLMYKMIVSDLHGFGEINSLKENTLGAILYMGNDPTSPPSFLPVGVPDTHYAMKIFVQVHDSLGAFSQVTVHATVQAPTEKNSPETVLHQLLNYTIGQNSQISTLLQKQEFLSAGYSMYIVASVLNSLHPEAALQADKARLFEHLINQSSLLPVNTLEEISQVVMVIAKSTQDTSGFPRVARELATKQIWQANQALQQLQQKDTDFPSEQIEMVSTGILTGVANILKMTAHHEIVVHPFYIIQSLTDTVLAGKVPADETTVMRTSGFTLYLRKMEKWTVTNVLGNEKQCRNCFQPTLNVNSVPSLSAKAPISVVFYEFADDPFPWLNYRGGLSADVVGFRMTGATAAGDVVEITPDVAEVYIGRKNLSAAAFYLTVGPEDEPGQVDQSSRKTSGAFRFEVDSTEVRELLVHIVTEVTVLFTVSVYAGGDIAPAALVASFLVPHGIPPVANQSGLFDPACAVRAAGVVCLPPSLLQVIAQRGSSSKCTMVVVLQAPHFVLKPNDRLVRIALFGAHCPDMHGIQREWREDICVLGEKTTWDRVHCVCAGARRARRQLGQVRLGNVHLHIRYLTARVIVPPNPIDLRLEVIRNLAHNPVTAFTVLFIILAYIVLAFWALHRDETDQFLQDAVIVLPDNDPYDNVCYLVTVFTGSRCGSGTRANVFAQLRGTEGTSDMHCLSHPHFKTFYRGSVNTFLLTARSDLGDIQSVRVWHNNQGRAPSWYLSRIKVENLFSRHIWLFMCRAWLSVDSSLDRTFPVTDPDEPLRREDFFLINAADRLGKGHMWFSVFAGVIAQGFTRLQRLSCCLAMLLSSLLCNIMFFNLDTDKDSKPRASRYIRSMAIGLESVLITLPVQVTITLLFTYSQRSPQATLEEVSPQERPVAVAEGGGHWEERLEKWHAQETAAALSREAEVPRAGRYGGPRRSARETPGAERPRGKARSKAPRSLRANARAHNANVSDGLGVSPGEPPPAGGPPPFQEKRRITLPRCCVWVAWCLVFATAGVSSFFIVFYGLTYGYERSIEWLFASFCSFCQSVFLVQPMKIILLSTIRSNRHKYCKNLPWVSNYRYTQIQLQERRLRPEEMRERHRRLARLRGTRMYQALAEDEIQIFKRKKSVKRGAALFLSYVLAHFLLLALLLGLAALLRRPDTFRYNQFIRGRFSVDLAAVTKLDDIYPWLDGVLLPLFHNHLRPTFLPDSSSKILGLPLMRQVRAKPGGPACPPTKHFGPNGIKGEIHCHPQYGVDPEDTENHNGLWKKVNKQTAEKNTKGFTYRPPEKQWAYYSHGCLHAYGSGGYVFYFFPDQQRFDSALRLRDLQSGGWLDEKTWAVILDLTTYSPDAGLFCTISIVFEASQLGVVNASVSAHSFALADLNRNTSAEIYLYLAILLFFLAGAGHEVYTVTQEGASYPTRVCNLLNLALKCTFGVLIALFLRKHFLATDILLFYSANSTDFVPFHAVSRVDHAMGIILGFLLFLTILKTLRYSRFFYDVRLAQRVIQTALPGICHTALLVATCFFVYVAFGCVVFGQHEWNYSSLVRATQTVFSYCVSAFRNTEFSSSRVLGVLFLSSFVLLLICILINLFKAVILDAYEDRRQPAYEEPSVEAEAIAYLCGKLRALLCFPSLQPEARDGPEFFVDMLYGKPEKYSHRYLGLKSRNINERKMVYLVV